MTDAKLPVPDITPTPLSVDGLGFIVSPDQPQSPTPEPPQTEEEEEEEPLGTPPPPPAANPWDIAAPPIIDTEMVTPEHGQVHRRPPVSIAESDAVSPASPEADMRYVLGTSPRRLDVGVMMMEAEERRRKELATDASAPSTAKATHPAAANRTVQPGPGPQQLRDAPATFSATILPSRDHRDSQASSVMSRESVQSSVSPAAAGSRGSMQSMPEDPDAITAAPPFPRTPTIPANFPEGIHEGIEAVPREYADREGLIPVGTESPHWSASTAARTSSLPPRDCTLGLNSSFFQYKGFCEGAKETTRGGSGIKKVKKPGFAGPQAVAKCSHCDFESDMHHLEMDQKHSGESFPTV